MHRPCCGPVFFSQQNRLILDNVDGARQRAESGELVFGTVETFLIWRLTEGRTHISDATNAARTSLLNISSGDWDEGMCALFNVPMQMLPDVVDCAGDLGRVTHLFGRELPILSAVGDQQSAAVGQACLTPGAIKSTYGTGCFVILNTGDKIVRSSNRLLSTVAWQLDGQRIYALEGSIFIAGAVIQWLRDGLHLLSSASDSEQMAAGLTGNDGYIWFRPLLVWARPGGMLRPEVRFTASPGILGRPSLPVPRLNQWPIRQQICLMPWLWMVFSLSGCVWMAAWPQMTG